MARQPQLQLPEEIDTANDLFFDALIRHQIGLLRLSGSIRNEVIGLLNATEQDINEQIRSRLSGGRGLGSPARVRAMNQLIATINASRLKSWREVNEVWVRDMNELSKLEPVFTDGLLKTAVPVTLETVIPATALLESLVVTMPFEGRVLAGWSANVSSSDIQRIDAQIRIGMVQGESSQQIARRVVGSASLNGKDGATQIARNQAAAITRTAVNAYSNAARRAYYVANEDIFRNELYVATLDSRTTPICRSLDGEVFPLGEGPLPPLHFNCRSLRIAVIDNNFIGKRPAKTSTEKGLLREFTAQQGIKGVSSRAALPFGTKGKFDAFSRTRIRELTGQVPAKTTYQEWLGRQSAQFQDDVLGVTKGRLFRRGDLPLDRFVNRNGDELTLSQLATRDRQAFIDAGLDPEDFI